MIAAINPGIIKAEVSFGCTGIEFAGYAL